MTKITKTNDEWKKSLSEDSYKVTRESGTERPYTGKYWDFNEKGVYKCICCNEPLFESQTKFDADVGGPVFLSQCMIQQYQSMKIIHLLEQELK